MKKDTEQDAVISKLISDVEKANRRSEMALRCAREALRLSLSTPRIGELLREIDQELEKG